LQRRFFWDLRPGRVLRWPADREMITARFLQVGDHEAIGWLQEQLDDDELRAWILKTRARGLSPRQIVYWSAMLDLPPETTRQLVGLAQEGPSGIW
jgi:hypothetical protein